MQHLPVGNLQQMTFSIYIELLLSLCFCCSSFPLVLLLTVGAQQNFLFQMSTLPMNFNFYSVSVFFKAIQHVKMLTFKLQCINQLIEKGCWRELTKCNAVASIYRMVRPILSGNEEDCATCYISVMLFDRKITISSNELKSDTKIMVQWTKDDIW